LNENDRVMYNNNWLYVYKKIFNIYLTKKICFCQIWFIELIVVSLYLFSASKSALYFIFFSNKQL